MHVHLAAEEEHDCEGVGMKVKEIFNYLRIKEMDSAVECTPAWYFSLVRGVLDFSVALVPLQL